MGGKRQKQKAKDKVVMPPQLPPEVPDEDIDVSDEDLNFVSKNKAFAGFVSRIDTNSIDKHVSRVANMKEDALEVLHERKLRKKALEKEEEKGIEVDRVDALPVKTMDGKLVYRTAPKAAKKPLDVGEEDGSDGDEEGDAGDIGVVKLTKAERREKLKRKKKEGKKQAKEQAEEEEEEEEEEKEEEEEDLQTPQSEVLAQVKEDLTAAENAESKQRKIAELGTALLEDPEANIKTLKEVLSFCRDENKAVAKSALLSALVVFRDIIPGYRIRLPTEKEQDKPLSKVVKKMRYYESTLLSSYKVYLHRLVHLVKLPEFHRVAIRCLCTLLDAHPHFNYREHLIQAVVMDLNSADDVSRKLCAATIRSLFTNEGKHGGEATVEIVQLISELVKVYDCQLHPDSIEVFLALSIDEDLGRSEKPDDNDKGKHGKKYLYKRRRTSNDEVQPVISDKKRSKQELLSKTRDEVNADYKAASFSQDEAERRRMQAETLSAVFNTYFRVLKNAIQPATVSSKVIGTPSGGALATYPLLSPCLKGVGMFAHLIDLDFMADLLKHLKILASGTNPGNTQSPLTVSERLECCIVAFKVMRKNLDALNVDLQDFFIHLYNLIVEYRPGRDQGEVLAEALKIMLCDDRQHDMQRAAAFIKRLATSSLSFGSAESGAALVTVQNLLQKNAKCRYLLENDVGGGSLGSVAKYQPYRSDPHLSGALASVLWELNLLAKHYHPIIAGRAKSIAQINSNPNLVLKATVTPQQAYNELVLERESFCIGNMKKTSHKLSRDKSSLLDDETSLDVGKDMVKKKLLDHFTVVHDIVENEKLRKELNLTTVSLQLYEDYKKQSKTKGGKSKKRKHS